VPFSTSEGRVRVATRGSPLALWQAQHVAGLIGAGTGLATELVVVRTRPDNDTSLPIRALGGQGLFTLEVSRAVLEDVADVAVHSAKDLPSSPSLRTEGLVIAAVPERGDPRDALAGSTLDQLGPGAIVATGSVRRRAQIAWLRPDLGFSELRGNIGTRLARRPSGGAVVVAAAALQRLGLDGEIAQIFEPWELLPQVGQGALAVECRAGDDDLQAMLASFVDHLPSHRAVLAERAFLAALGGGCDLPVGALAIADRDRGGAASAGLRLEALIATPDGHVVTRCACSGTDPEQLGTAVAAELVNERGASALLRGSGGLGDFDRPARRL
jgi:hydroxymethylbilane synthase